MKPTPDEIAAAPCVLPRAGGVLHHRHHPHRRWRSSEFMNVFIRLSWRKTMNTGAMFGGMM